MNQHIAPCVALRVSRRLNWMVRMIKKRISRPVLKVAGDDLARVVTFDEWLTTPFVTMFTLEVRQLLHESDGSETLAVREWIARAYKIELALAFPQ